MRFDGAWISNVFVWTTIDRPSHNATATYYVLGADVDDLMAGKRLVGWRDGGTSGMAVLVMEVTDDPE